jgi:hypothetical protein
VTDTVTGCNRSSTTDPLRLAPPKPFITSPSATSTTPSRLLRSVLTSLPSPLSLCLPGPHPALIGLLRHGYRIEDWDLAMATTDLTLPHPLGSTHQDSANPVRSQRSASTTTVIADSHRARCWADR